MLRITRALAAASSALRSAAYCAPTTIGIQSELRGHRERAIDFARLVHVERHRHLLRERRLQRIERRFDDRSRALGAGALVLRFGVTLPLRIQEALLRERDRAEQRTWIALRRRRGRTC